METTPHAARTRSGPGCGAPRGALRADVGTGHATTGTSDNEEAVAPPRRPSNCRRRRTWRESRAAREEGRRAAAVSAGAAGGGEAASGDGRTGRTRTRTAYSGHLVNAVRHRDVTDGCRAPRPSLTKRAPSSRSRGPRSGRTVSSARKHGSINAGRPKHSKALCTPQAHGIRHGRRERAGDFRDRGN